MRTRLKICGFTDVEEAVYAANLGVDAIGLVFYASSPRHVSIERVFFWENGTVEISPSNAHELHRSTTVFQARNKCDASV